ncbi:YraN family protein [Carnimonas nigrificans]|uniref:YraN family protein n=1 Tax=Carnimonas nigrificans TaxID=64323 RepID=UPI00046F4EB8|nr:YraN family protein [Carnimonas nigrificans]
MLRNQRAFGQRMETEAARFLVQQGLEEVGRNAHARGGEIDLVMRDHNTLVFVEVRYRRNNRYGSPLESVTATKQRRLITAASAYLQRHTLNCPCRFDVVAVTGGASHTLDFHWIKNAFELAL